MKYKMKKFVKIIIWVIVIYLVVGVFLFWPYAISDYIECKKNFYGGACTHQYDSLADLLGLMLFTLIWPLGFIIHGTR